MNDWTDAEIKRAFLRQNMFVRRGLHLDDAERLVDKCRNRDRDTDWRDMHACIECKFWGHDFNCSFYKKLAFPRSIFHRCQGFGWQVPRSN